MPKIVGTCEVEIDVDDEKTGRELETPDDEYEFLEGKFSGCVWPIDITEWYEVTDA